MAGKMGTKVSPNNETYLAIECFDSPSSVGEEAAELGDALADSVGPVDSCGADPTTGPVVLLAFTGTKSILIKKKNRFIMLNCLIPHFFVLYSLSISEFESQDLKLIEKLFELDN